MLYMDIEIIIGFIHPKKNKAIYLAVAIQHIKGQKIYNSKNIVLPFEKGTEIDFIIQYIEKLNGKLVLQTKIIKEQI